MSGDFREKCPRGAWADTTRVVTRTRPGPACPLRNAHAPEPICASLRAAMKHLSLTSLLALVVACNSSPLAFEPAGPDAAPDPSTFGPYAVGVRTVTLVDTNRMFEGEPRKIVTEVWYPAAEEARGQPGVTYDIKTMLTAEQRESVKQFDVPLLETIAVRDAAPFDADEKYPLIVFSHGQGGIRWQSTFYTVTLASHGYVVVSPDHQGNTLDYLLRDELSPTYEGIEDRPADASILIDEFTALPADHFLAGRIDAEQVGVTGHSFGAITSFRTAAFDDRVKAIVPQTPGFTDLALLGIPNEQKIEIPTLVQASMLDQTLPWEDNIPYTRTRVGGPQVHFDLKTGGHFSYSDLCRFDLEAMAPALGFGEVAEVVGDGCGEGAPSADKALPLINQFAVGFFNGVLRKSPGSFDYLSQEKADAKAPGIAEVSVDLKGLK